jgi:hypothetical protein
MVNSMTTKNDVVMGDSSSLLSHIAASFDVKVRQGPRGAPA